MYTKSSWQCVQRRYDGDCLEAITGGAYSLVAAVHSTVLDAVFNGVIVERKYRGSV